MYICRGDAHENKQTGRHLIKFPSASDSFELPRTLCADRANRYNICIFSRPSLRIFSDHRSLSYWNYLVSKRWCTFDYRDSGGLRTLMMKAKSVRDVTWLNDSSSCSIRKQARRNSGQGTKNWFGGPSVYSTTYGIQNSLITLIYYARFVLTTPSRALQT